MHTSHRWRGRRRKRFNRGARGDTQSDATGFSSPARRGGGGGGGGGGRGEGGGAGRRQRSCGSDRARGPAPLPPPACGGWSPFPARFARGRKRVICAPLRISAISAVFPSLWVDLSRCVH